MSLKSIALASGIMIAGLAALYPPAAAAAVVVGVRLPAHAPPALRVERVGPARHGRIWIPGYWRWHHARYVWVGGHWARARVGYHYVPARWVACGRHWCFHRGYWAR